MTITLAIFRVKDTVTNKCLPPEFTSKMEAKALRNKMNGVTDESFGTGQYKISRGKDHRHGESK